MHAAMSDKGFKLAKQPLSDIVYQQAASILAACLGTTKDKAMLLIPFMQFIVAGLAVCR